VLTLLILPRAFKNALFPTLCRLFRDPTGRERFGDAFRQAAKLMALVGFPLAFLIFSQAGPIVDFLYASKFAEAVAPLRVMGFCLLFTYLYSASQAALDSSHNEGASALVWLAATLINIAVDLVVIPRYGYVGSAMATLISEAVVFIGSYLILRIRLGLRLSLATLAQIAAVSGVTAWVVSILQINVILVGAAAVLLYPGLVWLSGLLSGREIRALLAKAE